MGGTVDTCCVVVISVLSEVHSKGGCVGLLNSIVGRACVVGDVEVVGTVDFVGA